MRTIRPYPGLRVFETLHGFHYIVHAINMQSREIVLSPCGRTDGYKYRTSYLTFYKTAINKHEIRL